MESEVHKHIVQSIERLKAAAVVSPWTSSEAKCFEFSKLRRGVK